MNTKNMLLWADALESNEYAQGRDAILASPAGETFCCLGVACEVAIKNGVPIKRELDTYGDMYLYDEQASFLPGSVADWLGTRSPTVDPSIGGNIFLLVDDNGTIDCATDMNDSKEMTFKDIAACIRRTVEAENDCT